MRIILTFLFSFLIVIHLCGIPLFEEFPHLQEKLPYIPLADLPTPVKKLESFNMLWGKTVYIKLDNVTGPQVNHKDRLFGGNKVRKLSFLLADALAQNAKAVMTFGGVGSNHAVATTVYTHFLGLPSICLLTPQPNSQTVRRNLLLQQYYNADLHYYSDTENRSMGVENINNQFQKMHGSIPYLIPTGGSNPVGITGFVNAAFELKKQIDHHELPEPDYIYVPVGSMGTITGLLLGCKVIGLKSKIIGVCIEPMHQIENTVIELAYKTNELLHELDNTFPLVSINGDDFLIRYEFSGTDYGLFTYEGEQAIKYLWITEDIALDGTYTGKTFACLLHDIQTEPILQDKTVLFWNTYCSDDFYNILRSVDYRSLPPHFHCYFEQEIQAIN